MTPQSLSPRWRRAGYRQPVESVMMVDADGQRLSFKWIGPTPN